MQLQLEKRPCSLQLEKALTQQWRPTAAKYINNKYIYIYIYMFSNSLTFLPSKARALHSDLVPTIVCGDFFFFFLPYHMT